MRTPAIARWAAGSLARWRGMITVNYHRIGDGRDSLFDRGLWSATEEDLDRQLRYLKASFDIITPRDISYVVRLKRGRHCLITFDDGYADNYTAAFPILTTHKVPASFFVATGYIDDPRLPWWDEIAWMVRSSKRRRVELPTFLPRPVPFDEPERERAVRTLLRTYKRLPAAQATAYLHAIGDATGTGRPPSDVIDPRSLWMTWDMLREMHAAGMTIGGHTVHHPILARMTREAQREEIATCERRIVEELGVPMRSFAYPVGDRDAFDDATIECLRALGVTTAFSFYCGFRRMSEWDNYDIPRLCVDHDTTFNEFRAMVMLPSAA